MSKTDRQIRAALYARVSTAGKGQNTEVQLKPMIEDAGRRGWTIHDVYPDEGHSGSKESRPALDRLWSDVRAGKVDVVMVWKFDRFARSVRQLVAALEEFRARGVQFVSMQNGIDTTTPQGALLFYIIAAIAEFERELIRERVYAGLEHARSQGKRLGRPTVEVDRQRVTELRGQGLSWQNICDQLKISYGTARRALLKPEAEIQ